MEIFVIVALFIVIFSVLRDSNNSFVGNRSELSGATWEDDGWNGPLSHDEEQYSLSVDAFTEYSTMGWEDSFDSPHDAISNDYFFDPVYAGMSGNIYTNDDSITDCDLFADSQDICSSSDDDFSSFEDNFSDDDSINLFDD